MGLVRRAHPVVRNHRAGARSYVSVITRRRETEAVPPHMPVRGVTHGDSRSFTEQAAALPGLRDRRSASCGHLLMSKQVVTAVQIVVGARPRRHWVA